MPQRLMTFNSDSQERLAQKFSYGALGESFVGWRLGEWVLAPLRLLVWVLEAVGIWVVTHWIERDLFK